MSRKIYLLFAKVTNQSGCDSWSRNSRFVLTSSKDWNVIIWDLASPSDPPSRYTTVRFDAPVLSASFHPRNMYVSVFYLFVSELNVTITIRRILLVLLTTGEAYLVDLRKEHRGRFELVDVSDESDDEGNTGKVR